MVRRIIGQCSYTDFASIEHLASVIDNPEQLDGTTLSKSQRLAFRFIYQTQARGISWKLLLEVVQEVLFWGTEEGDISHIEVKLKRRANVEKLKEFKRLW
jgi:hypothetical protein